MKATRLLRAAVASTRTLEAGAPTGLTGLLTHPSPRPSLIFTYNDTLEKLKQLPESSVYRQSVEALTKHRLAIVEGVKPEGLKEWQDRVRSTIEAHPSAFKTVAEQLDPKQYNFVIKEVQGYATKLGKHEDEQVEVRSETDMARLVHEVLEDNRSAREEIESLETEPPLSVEQINEVESKIGAGLIEEIVQVAEGESALVDTMIQYRVWEELEEKPAEGQWTYHERDTHVPKTQAPPP